MMDQAQHFGALGAAAGGAGCIGRSAGWDAWGGCGAGANLSDTRMSSIIGAFALAAQGEVVFCETIAGETALSVPEGDEYVPVVFRNLCYGRLSRTRTPPCPRR